MISLKHQILFYFDLLWVILWLLSVVTHYKIMDLEESRRRASARDVAKGFAMINEKGPAWNQEDVRPGFTRLTGRVQWPSMAPESFVGRSAAAR